jgi:hypothetical protein
MKAPASKQALLYFTTATYISYFFPGLAISSFTV